MTVSVQDRPQFSTCYANSLRIYKKNASDEEVLQHVAKTIGGLVWTNICKPDKKDKSKCVIDFTDDRKWHNACAVRLSYILNKSGVDIPAIPNQTVTGGDKKQYFYRVENIHRWLQSAWGKKDASGNCTADIVIGNPTTQTEIRDASGNVVLNPDGSAKLSEYGEKLAGRQGILIFFPIAGWGDAGGHATLFDGKSCYDHCYFNPGSNYTTRQAHFWELP